MNTSMNPVQASDKLQSLFERDERLIDVIASHSPQLAKLRHSPMRRIMARVTTVAQAARVCKMNVESLVNELNGVLGIRSANISASPVAATSDDSTPLPPFTSVVELDVRDELEKGGEPFSRIMAAVAGLGDDAVLHLRAPFEPVPLFGVMEKRGFGHKAEQHATHDLRPDQLLMRGEHERHRSAEQRRPDVGRDLKSLLPRTSAHRRLAYARSGTGTDASASRTMLTPAGVPLVAIGPATPGASTTRWPNAVGASSLMSSGTT